MIAIDSKQRSRLGSDMANSGAKKAASETMRLRKYRTELQFLTFRRDRKRGIRAEDEVAHRVTGGRHVERLWQDIPLADISHIDTQRASNGTGSIVAGGNLRQTVLHHVLVRRTGDLLGIIDQRFLNRAGTNLLEGRNRHGGQEADDDDDNHNFNEGKTLGSVGCIHIYF